MRLTVVIALCSLAIVSCSTVKFSVSIDVTPSRAITSPSFVAGAASTDLTIPPGYPMMGYSIAGQFSRGSWVPITCNTVFMRDTAGTPYFIVSTDLWAMPGGLASRAVEIMHMIDPATKSMGLENVMCTALHIHHCGGNFATCASYNTAASFGLGFDQALFNYLAQKIAHSMIEARANAIPVTVRYSEMAMSGLSRNRSYAAFLQNDSADRASLFAENRHVDTASITAWPASLTSRITAMAVDPMLRLIQFRSVLTGKAIAVVPIYAIHATATGGATEVYSSDVYGVAREVLRMELMKDTSLVVAFLNGSEGDVEPNYLRHDRSDAMRIGRQLAAGVQSLLGSSDYDDLTGTLTPYYMDQRIGGQTFPFDQRDGDCYCTYPSELQTDVHSMIGTAMFGGALDGRTIFYSLGCRDGMIADECDPIQGVKLPALKTVVDLMVTKGVTQSVATSLVGMVSESAPDHAPVSMLALKDLLLVGMPGEFTTMMGKFIRDTLQRISGKKHVAVVGFANEYASYITTPCEYRAQFYEGASTLFGQASGPWFKFLAVQTFNAGPALPTSRTLQYDAGSANTFGVRSDHTDPWWNAAYDLSNLLVDEKDGRPLRVLQILESPVTPIASDVALRYTFTDTTVALRPWLDHSTKAADTVRYLPTVSIVTEDGIEPTLKAMSTEIIVTLDKMTQGTAQWSVYFMGMERMKGRLVTLTITTPGNRVIPVMFDIQ
ncbi:hypothetical protein BH10BAC6_BH10BAC6_14820 [soil metagenome]